MDPINSSLDLLHLVDQLDLSLKKDLPLSTAAGIYDAITPTEGAGGREWTQEIGESCCDWQLLKQLPHETADRGGVDRLGAICKKTLVLWGSSTLFIVSFQ